VKNKSPWLFIPPLYFAEGLIYIIVNTLSVVMYKRLGVSNAVIGITSLLYLPWVLKMLWAPIVAGTATKRFWIVVTQALVALLLGASALSLHSEWFLFFSLAAFIVAAFLSATHDVAADGFYMLALSNEQQSFFVGVRSLFYRLAMIFGSGTLVYIAGKWEASTGSVTTSWSRVLGIGCAIYAVMSLYSSLILPKPASDIPELQSENVNAQKLSMAAVFKTYFSRQGVLPLILFVIFFRFGEALLLKMVAPFLIDSAANGGLALTTSEVGLVYGTVGLVSLMVGGIAGGAIIAKAGLRKTIWPYALAMNVPSIFYVYMAVVKPTLPYVYGMIAIEQFCYGVGMTALTVVLISSSKGSNKTSNFAISTGIMAIGMMVPGLISGWIQERMGYALFFAFAVSLSIPGMVLIRFLPNFVFEKE
jgi:PAT family beta-lactamase induction signal transducer AmpG